ncbi:MAG: helicase-related protein, partial [Cytophagales bacterium]
KGISPKLKVWGISATIGNLDRAKEVLLGVDFKKSVMVKASIEKRIEVNTLFPETIETMPWAGHLGLSMLPKVVDLVEKSKSTLVFTNTRSQSEIWYAKILEYKPEWAGIIALHHGSLDAEIRNWVEEALHKNLLKVVVCTSSLDLGVDFRPVDTVIQIGSPKGVARFLQRAGRSGHRPGEVSRIYFVPTHSLELLEGSAIKKAVSENRLESKPTFVNSFDVLLQYLCTLAAGEGFEPEKTKEEVLSTYCYQWMSDEQWNWCLSFLTHGGNSLDAYDEFKKLIWDENIVSLKIANKRLAMKHRLSIGTIMSDGNMQVVYLSGKRIGTIEEWFVARLKPGDVFWFSGKALELVMVKEMKAMVKNSKSSKGIIPSWMGGRMPLSSELSDMIRNSLNRYIKGVELDDEIKALVPIFELQSKRSMIPDENELLIEFFKSKEGNHLFIYPFEGRFVHEALASLIAVRIGKHSPITFSIAMNDYGFELLTDIEIDPESILELDIFSVQNLENDILQSANSTELAKRRFREIAGISGLVFNGFPGKQLTTKHTQANSQLFFKVFEEYEPENLLFRQAFDEVFTFNYEMERMHNTFERISKQKIVLKYCEKPSPFAFPIMVDRLRMKFSNEDITNRVERMLKQYE